VGDRKRDEKMKDKREIAVTKILREQHLATKDSNKSKGASDAVASTVRQVVDQDLESESDDEDNDDEDDDSDEDDEDDEEAESESN
jgi:hypothetical protein